MTAPQPLTLDRTNWFQHAAPQVDSAQWTAVVAAAGKGSRLGFNRPKILFPVAGRPILEWLLDLLLPSCQTAVFVLSPDGRDEVEPELERLAAGRYRIAIQPVPTGMGDAVEIGAAQAATPHTMVLWGDQVALRPASVEAVLRLHQGPLSPDLTVPTVLRHSPYIHFERDAAGRIARLLQAREGDAMPEYGESDTGMFCFRTEVLRRLLVELRATGAATGAGTAEFNLLPIIPFAAGNAHYVLAARLMDVEETVGVNSAADAGRVEAFLRSAHG
jgi:bifunctional UDP-N-acetylglucosamine pyrophosphorylase/glucosamine-1-phosphate N-acetyltransferase